MRFSNLTGLLAVPVVISILSGAGLPAQGAERGKFMGARETVYPAWCEDVDIWK